MISVLVRASLGSLATLGIYSLKLLAKPTTLYILQYSPDGCQAGCKFCPQAKINNADKNFVARVPWPLIELDVIIDKLKKGKQVFSRICVQNVLKKDFSIFLYVISLFSSHLLLWQVQVLAAKVEPRI